VCKDKNVGRQIKEYVIESKLGEGGMAVVYSAYHQITKDKYAIKLLKPCKKDQYHRMKREGQMQRELQHPNIVRIYDLFEINGSLMLIMEYIEDGSLEELLQGRKLSTEECVNIFEQIVAGVAFAHGMGLIHRDLKPENILIKK
jgi:eukaryotic-like serine/threonine-protein kinase